MDIAATVSSLRASLNAPPYCSGTCLVTPDQFRLFYEVDETDTARKIDLSQATSADLEKLANACQPASFGRNKEEVYDESYRKALKLDATAFSTQFDAERSGLVGIIRQELLECDNDKREIMLELYKLNVYGKGSFFKPHKDTPRHETMFGSLVVVFPTPHEGGEFVLRHRGNEWVVDFARMLSHTVEPSVGYVAFFSDTEHEVRVVESGHRVTLTYNLYFKSEKPVADVAVPLPLPYELSLTDTLGRLISEPEFMPRGGYIGFGLRHQYPVSYDKAVNSLRTCLKGSDAAIARALAQLSLEWNLFVLYQELCWLETDCLLPHPMDLSDYMRDYDAEPPMNFPEDPILVQFAEASGQLPDLWGCKQDLDEDAWPIFEVTKMTSMISTETTFRAYGNHPEAVHVYGHVVLVAFLPEKSSVLPVGERESESLTANRGKVDELSLTFT